MTMSSLLVSDLDPATLDAQRAFNVVLADMPHPDLSQPGALELLRAGTRPEQAEPMLRPVDMSYPSDGARRVRVFVPDGTPRGLIVRLHGGGFVAGAPEDDEAVNDEIARRCAVVVASPTYRLLPESTRAHQLADCLAATRWAMSQFRGPVVIAGTSAGAHLALVTALKLRAHHPEQFGALVGLHLDCGGYDMSGTPSSRAATDQTLVLTRSWLDAFHELAAPGLGIDELRGPDFSPLYADLAGLPPAMLLAGQLDPLADDTAFLAARMVLAGVSVDATIWPHGAHAFSNMGAPLQPVALARTVEWLNHRLG